MPRLTSLRRLVAAVGLVLLAAGCAHYPLNARQAPATPGAGYRFEALPAGDNSDSLFICLAFSGGGTRAAAFAYGVLAKLASLQIDREGRRVSLLDEVDCISSVSGGSFTAAYYGLHGRATVDTPDFLDRVLYHDIQGELLRQALDPLNWPRLASPYFSRIDLAAELYDRTIFDHKTFADLLAAGRRPFIMINATEMQLGDRFEFTQDRFDLLGSDLLRLPVARAVAASSAFPLLLSPVTLKNYCAAGGCAPSAAARAALGDYYVNRRRYAWARSRAAYTEPGAHLYVHLMDGGLADNIGMRAIADAYARGFIRSRLQGRIKELVIIAANARTAPPERFDASERPPGLRAMAYKTATVSMENYSFESVELMRELAGQREQAERSRRACEAAIEKRCPDAPGLPPLAGAGMESYVIELGFETVADEAQRTCFLGLPTTFALRREQVDALVTAAGELLDADPNFQRLLAKLGAKPGKEPAARPPAARCQP